MLSPCHRGHGPLPLLQTHAGAGFNPALFYAQGFSVGWALPTIIFWANLGLPSTALPSPPPPQAALSALEGRAWRNPRKQEGWTDERPEFHR